MTSCLIPVLAGESVDWDMLDDDHIQAEQHMWEYVCWHCDAKMAMEVLMDESHHACVRFDSVRKVRWLRCVSFGGHNKHSNVDSEMVA